MNIVAIIGITLGVVGLMLTIPFLYTKLSLKEYFGWALASLGMFILFVHQTLFGNVFFAMMSLLFTIVNTYFCVNYFNETKKKNGNNN